MAFAATAATVAGGGIVAVPAGWNGTQGAITVASNVERIKRKNMLVVNGAGLPLLTETLACHWYQVAGAHAAVVPMNNALYDQCKEYVGSRIGINEVVGLAAIASVPVGLRNDHCINPAQYAAATNAGAHVAPLLQFAQAIVAQEVVDTEVAAEVAPHGKFCVLKIGFSAIHRAVLEVHNGYSDATQKKNTVSNKCAAVAGGEKEGFLDFIVKVDRTHDAAHESHDCCLDGRCHRRRTGDCTGGHYVSG